MRKGPLGSFLLSYSSGDFSCISGEKKSYTTEYSKNSIQVSILQKPLWDDKNHYPQYPTWAIHMEIVESESIQMNG